MDCKGDLIIQEVLSLCWVLRASQTNMSQVLWGTSTRILHPSLQTVA